MLFRSVQAQNILNLYLTDPDPSVFDIGKLYDVKSTFYQKISKFYKLSDVVIRPDIDTIYKGDCFLQRGFLKTKFNPKYAPSLKSDVPGLLTLAGLPVGSSWPNTEWEDVDGLARSFSFGRVYSAITEMNIIVN